MSDCVFCKIIAGEIPSKKVFEDEYVYAFEDINPQAPKHVLAVPKKHIASANEIDADNSKYVAHIFESAKKIAELMGIKNDGYRIINNCGKNAGQTVFHLHFHIMGGCDMGEKLL